MLPLTGKSGPPTATAVLTVSGHVILSSSSLAEERFLSPAQAQTLLDGVTPADGFGRVGHQLAIQLLDERCPPIRRAGRRVGQATGLPFGSQIRNP